MVTIQINNKRTEGIQPDPLETIVDVDRTHPIWGNTHVYKDPRDFFERAYVFERYRMGLEEDWSNNGPMRRAINDLAKRTESGERLTLRCRCDIRPCHAELIAEKVALVLGLKHEPPVYADEAMTPDEPKTSPKRKMRA